MRDIDEINAEALNENEAIKQAILSGDSDVQKFYDNAVVFITGGSGFIGKQLIEKLLRSCNIMKIYILLRVKKNKTIKEKLEAILKDPVYDELHKEQPNFVHKIVPIEGDIESLKLGINDESWKTLAEEVDVIVHAAATTNFNEAVKTATLTNIRGAREVLKLAKISKHLNNVSDKKDYTNRLREYRLLPLACRRQFMDMTFLHKIFISILFLFFFFPRSLVHVSTAYSHATRSRVGKEVEEDFYESPISPDILIELAETMDNELLTAMITPLMKEWPNTYTLTKAVAEELIRVQGRGLPVCIVRPAIVIGSYREPCPGWVDVKNVYGPSGLVLGIGLGVLHTLLVNNNAYVDFVPVDIVNNIIIVAAYETQTKYASGRRQINIYAATKSRTPSPLGVLNASLSNEARNIATSKSIWYCFGITTPYRFIYRILTWIFHYIPAVIVDGICKLFGQKPRLVQVYKTVSSLSSVLQYFLNNDWVFQDTNTLSMYNNLSQTDKLIYNCDLASVNARELYYKWAYGVRRFIVKDDVKQRKYAQRKQTVLKYIHYLVLPVYLYALLKIPLMVVKIILHGTKRSRYIYFKMFNRCTLC